MTDAAGLLDPASAVRIVRTGCRLAGMSTDGVELLRFGEDAVGRLPNGVLVRVGRAGAAAASGREVAVSRWLVGMGVPTNRPARNPALVQVLDRAVTFWCPLPPHRPATSIGIAVTLRRLHGLTPPSDPALPPVDPFRRIGPRLLRSPLLGRSERESLLTRLDDLQAGFAAGVPPGLPSSVVHGDAWAGNVVETDSGEVLLLDLGRVGIGPPEWDLVATVLNRTTFGIMGEEEYAAFCSAYGHDVMTWQGFPLLRDIRELWVVAFALQAAEVDGQAVPQARARVQDLLAGRRPWPGWAPL